MTTKLYVGNLSYNTTEDQIRDLISKSGSVESVSLITDKYSGQSKGFAFVEMQNDDAKKAMAEANGVELDGRTIVVNEAKPPKHSSGGFGGGRGGGGGYGGKNRGGGRGGFGRSRY